MPSLVTIATGIDGFRLDVPGSNFVAHQKLQIYPPNSPISLNQTWTLVSSADGVPVPDGFVNIFAGDEPANHLCLDVPDSRAEAHVLVQLYPLNRPGGTPNQQWKLIPAANNLVLIASALNTELVLDVRGGGGAPHTPVQIYPVGDLKPNQLWAINPAD